MITHKIEVEVPVAVPSSGAGPANLSLVDQARPALVCKNQRDLDAALAFINCPIGTFLTYVNASVHSLACIHLVTQVETNYELVQKSPNHRTVRPYFVAQCDAWSPTAHTWCRFDDLAHFRPITQVEWKKYVEKEIANIQDRCERHLPAGFKIPAYYTNPGITIIGGP